MKDFYSVRGFGKEDFSLYWSPYENCFFLSRNAHAVVGLFAYILAGENFLLNNNHGLTAYYARK